MKVNSESIKLKESAKLETSEVLSSKLCFCAFLILCLLGYFAGAEISEKPLDPTDILTRRFAKASPGVNAPKAEAKTADMNAPGVAVPIAEPPSDPQVQLQTVPDLTEPPSGWFPAHVRQGRPQSGFPVAANLNRQLGRQLWQARITVPEIQEDDRGRDELGRIIQQVRAVEFKPQSETPERAVVVESPPKAEPQEKETESKLSSSPSAPKLQVPRSLPYEPVSDQTLQVLESLAQRSDRPNNALALGDVLFLSGNLKQAATFYQKALEGYGPDNTGSVQDKAWILFQIGNCLRRHDPPNARKMYRQLITQYPDAPWADLAKAQDELIDCYQKNKPRAFTAE